MIFDDNGYEIEEIKEDFNKITELLNKHNVIMNKADFIFALKRNGSLEEEDWKEYNMYAKLTEDAQNGLFFMKTVLQPALQQYIDIYINNFSKNAIRDWEEALELERSDEDE